MSEAQKLFDRVRIHALDLAYEAEFFVVPPGLQYHPVSTAHPEGGRTKRA